MSQSPADLHDDRKKRKDKNDEKGFRAYFLRLLGRYDFRNEEQFIRFGKWLTFIALIIVEALIVLQHFDNFAGNGGWAVLIAILALECVLTVSEALKLFVVKKGKGRIVFYVLDAVVASLFLFFTGGTFSMVAYMLVLTEFYISAERTRFAILLFAIGTPVYGASYAVHQYLNGATLNWLSVFTELLGYVFVFIVHFLTVQIALAFYRQFLKLDKALKELDESKKELEKAYEAVAEVTALEERQRIAKEIHDTAGHSLTTVIMQTEAAKLILDKNPEEAKQKIVAANLRAKHALEELRESVHLLSGISGNETLKEALERIIHETTDGTGIKIRSEIDEADVMPAKFRFICNTLKEGISNGLRHGNATAFWFELKQTDKIEFVLSDNGTGIKGVSVTPGFGLTTMQQRAKALGGEIRFESEPNEGFEIRLTLPTDPR